MSSRDAHLTLHVDAAIERLMTLAAKGVEPQRIAREVEVIVAEWLHAPDAQPTRVKSHLGAIREQIVAGVGDAQEQLAAIDTREAAAVKQAQVTLAALVATRDATTRALASF